MMRASAALPLLAFLLMVGTACQQPSLYRWGSYESSVWQVTSGEELDVDGSIVALAGTIERARAEDGLIPPGMHAHLGLLYGRRGELDLAVAAFESEKELYPESATFVDGVIARMGASE